MGGRAGWRWLPLAFGLAAACGAGRESRRPTAVEVPRPAAPGEDAGLPSASDAETAPPVRCEREEVRLEAEGAERDLGCYPDCGREAPSVTLRLVNCTSQAVSLSEIGAAGAEPSFVTVRAGPEGPVPPGTRSAPYEIAIAGSGYTILRLRVVGSMPDADAAPAFDQILALAVKLRDEKREEAIAACKARGDHWGPRGMAGTEKCWKVLPDADKPCADERDCQGSCLMDGETIVSTTQKRVHGHCSRFETHFGCATRIGRTQNGLMPRNRSFAHMCVD